MKPSTTVKTSIRKIGRIMTKALQTAIKELGEELAGTFANDTLAHDIVKGELPDEVEIESLAQSYLTLRKFAWAVLTMDADAKTA